MKISIITVCLNSEKTIADTLDSIGIQTFSDIEVIIVDGGSTDGTLLILEHYSSIIAKIISGSDKGIYDAMNKGILASTGDIIGTLNSDDVLASPEILQEVHDRFLQSRADCLYGDLLYVDQHNLLKTIRYWKAGLSTSKSFHYGWSPPHPTFYVKRQVFNECGLYRLDIRVAADYEFMLRVMLKCAKTATYLPLVMVKMRLGGISSAGLLSRKDSLKENRISWKKNRLSPFLLTPHFKMVRKIFQYVYKNPD